jgi:Tfp pilus assembly protein PilO
MSLWRRIVSERRAIVLPLVAVLAINGAVLAAAVLPLKRMVGSAQDEAIASTLTLAQARNLERQAQGARASRDRADAELKKFYAQILPVDEPAAVEITYLEIFKLAREAGLTAQRRSFAPVTVKDSRLQRFSTEVTLVGEYAAIRKFIYDLETSQAFLVVESVAIAQANQQQRGGASAAAAAASGAIQVTLAVSTYYQGTGK